MTALKRCEAHKQRECFVTDFLTDVGECTVDICVYKCIALWTVFRTSGGHAETCIHRL